MVDCSYSIQRGVLAPTSACASIVGHGVSMTRTGTLVAARDVDTLEGTEVSNTLGAFVNIYEPDRPTERHTDNQTHDISAITL